MQWPAVEALPDIPRVSLRDRVTNELRKLAAIVLPLLVAVVILQINMDPGLQNALMGVTVTTAVANGIAYFTLDDDAKDDLSTALQDALGKKPSRQNK